MPRRPRLWPRIPCSSLAPVECSEDRTFTRWLSLVTRFDKCSECPAHPSKTSDPLLDVGKLRFGALLYHGTTRFRINSQRKKFADLLERKAEILCVSDEGQPRNHVRWVRSVSRTSARRFRDQPFALIESNGFHANSTSLRDFADPERVLHAKLPSACKGREYKPCTILQSQASKISGDRAPPDPGIRPITRYRDPPRYFC